LTRARRALRSPDRHWPRRPLCHRFAATSHRWSGQRPGNAYGRGGSYLYHEVLLRLVAQPEATSRHPLPARAEHDRDVDTVPLQTLIYGASPISVDTLRRVLGVLPDVAMVSLYGQPRSRSPSLGSPITSLSPDDHRLDAAKDPDVLSTVGRPASGLRLHIDEPTGPASAKCSPPRRTFPSRPPTGGCTPAIWVWWMTTVISGFAVVGMTWWFAVGRTSIPPGD
jgi:acyl-CoA synthetase (AMP-forming)/AMP-acid ligase II